LRNLVGTPARWNAPLAWSPDDHCVAYGSLKPQEKDGLTVMDVRTGKILVEIPAAGNPGWANAHTVVYQADGAIWSLDVDHPKPMMLFKGALPESGNFLAP
jgi:hypothetical protein